MSGNIASAVFDGAAMKRVYENDKWTVGIKNYRPVDSFEGFSELGRHHGTDELFVLLAGACVLVTMEERDGKRQYSCADMQPGAVYTVPRGVWHVIITEKRAKLLIVEDSSTGSANSDVMTLGEADRSAVRGSVENEKRRRR